MCLTIPKLLEPFNKLHFSGVNVKYDDSEDDWISNLPTDTPLGINILNLHPKMSLFKGKGTVELVSDLENLGVY